MARHATALLLVLILASSTLAASCLTELARPLYRDFQVEHNTGAPFAVSPDGTWLVAALSTSGFVVFNLDSNKTSLIHRLALPRLAGRSRSSHPIEEGGTSAEWYRWKNLWTNRVEGITFAGFGVEQKMALFFAGGKVEIWNFDFSLQVRGRFPYRFTRKFSYPSASTPIPHSISPDGRYLFGCPAIDDDKLTCSVTALAPWGSKRVFSFRTDSSVSAGALSPGADKLVLADSRGLKAVSVPERKPVVKLPDVGTTSAIQFSPDGNSLAVDTDEGVVFFSTDDLRTPKKRLSEFASPHFGFSPDSRFGWVGQGRSVIVFDTRHWQNSRRFSYPPKSRLVAPWDSPLPSSVAWTLGSVRPVAFSPDGRMMAAFVDDAVADEKSVEPIILWSVETGRPLALLPSPLHAESGFFSEDGRHLAVGSRTSGVIRVFDTTAARAYLKFSN